MASCSCGSFGSVLAGYRSSNTDWPGLALVIAMPSNVLEMAACSRRHCCDTGKGTKKIKKKLEDDPNMENLDFQDFTNKEFWSSRMS